MCNISTPPRLNWSPEVIESFVSSTQDMCEFHVLVQTIKSQMPWDIAFIVLGLLPLVVVLLRGKAGWFALVMVTFGCLFASLSLRELSYRIGEADNHPGNVGHSLMGNIRVVAAYNGKEYIVDEHSENLRYVNRVAPVGFVMGLLYPVFIGVAGISATTFVARRLRHPGLSDGRK